MIKFFCYLNWLEVMELIKKIDFSFQKINFLTVLALIFTIVLVGVFNIQDIEENSLLENFQCIALILGFIYCIFSKSPHKKLFILGALIFFLMFMREISYGRVIFAQIEGQPNCFYSWSHYKYGYLAHIIIGLYIGICALYALVNKLWINAIELFKTIKFPMLPFLICVFSVVVQMLSEKYLHNTIVEETSELVLYFSLFAICYIYSKKAQ